MTNSQQEIQDFFRRVKVEMLRANHDRKHAFRTLVLGTFDDYPSLRTMVKRKTFEDFTTLIYSDARSCKLSHLHSDIRCTQLYYDSRKKLQVLIYGSCEIISEGAEFLQHEAIALQNQKDYNTSLPPKTKIESAVYDRHDQTHFILLKIIPEEIEILQLAATFHKRASYTRNEEWKGQWLVP